ncbi:MAG: cell division protein SepF [Candidatus Aenigmatarchaeota archaeon]
MPFGKFFSSREEESLETEADNYVEVNVMDAGEKKTGKISIRLEKLNEFGDTERVLKIVRDGSIVFLKIKGLKEKDMGELKRAVEKIKKTVLANNGDIAGVENDWLIISPQFAAVER